MPDETNPTESSSGPAWLVPVISGAAALLVEGVKLLVEYLKNKDVSEELSIAAEDLDVQIKALEDAFEDVKKKILTSLPARQPPTTP